MCDACLDLYGRSERDRLTLLADYELRLGGSFARTAASRRKLQGLKDVREVVKARSLSVGYWRARLPPTDSDISVRLMTNNESQVSKAV